MVDGEGFIDSICVSNWYARDGSRVPQRIGWNERGATGDKGYGQESVYKAVQRDSKDANIIIQG